MGGSEFQSLTCERFVNSDFLVVIPLPFDVGLGRTRRLAGQGLVGTLADDNVAATERVVDVWWH